MKKYYYSEEDKQFGPLSIEELKLKKITKDTMIWYESLDNWIKASSVDELKGLFKSTPPPLEKNKKTPPPLNVKDKQKSNQRDTNIRTKKKKTALIIGLIAISIAIAFVMFFVINRSQSNNNSNTQDSELNSFFKQFKTEPNNNHKTKPPKKKTEKELKRELANTECATPVKYLKMYNETLRGTFKNALSLKFNGFKVKFDIYNNATIVTFKNVKCQVILSSNSGSIILSKNFTVSEYIGAGSSITYNGEFECTNQQFKDTDTYSIQILGAECN